MGTHLNRLVEAVLTSTYIYVLNRNKKNIRIFLSENFPFLVVKFSIYLNRRVFVIVSLLSVRTSIPSVRPVRNTFGFRAISFERIGVLD